MQKNISEEPGPATDSTARRIKLTLTLSLIVFIWIISFYMLMGGFAEMPRVQSSDLSTVISGTGTIALSVFSILVAVAAIYGINSLDRKVRDEVRSATKEHLARTEKELRGRSFAILGYLIGENSVKPDLSGPLDKERLKEAIYYSEHAYQFLRGTNLAVEFMALNNFLGYSCALHAQEKQNANRLLKYAARLRKAAEEHDDGARVTNLLLTYARAIYLFSQDPEERANADKTIRHIDISCLNSKEYDDALRVRESFKKDREQKSQAPPTEPEA